MQYNKYRWPNSLGTRRYDLTFFRNLDPNFLHEKLVTGVRSTLSIRCIQKLSVQLPGVFCPINGMEIWMCTERCCSHKAFGRFETSVQKNYEDSHVLSTFYMGSEPCFKALNIKHKLLKWSSLFSNFVLVFAVLASFLISISMPFHYE